MSEQEFLAAPTGHDSDLRLAVAALGATRQPSCLIGGLAVNHPSLQPRPMKIILGGAPRSGKSCLRYALREALKARQPACPYPYVITACPDGEGAWYHETTAANQQLANKLKAENKSKFTDVHADHYAGEVRNCALPLTLIDIGGRIDDKNERICAPATHAILTAAELHDLDAWKAFCRKLGITVLAELESAYEAKEDRPLTLGEDGIYRGSIHHLERGDASLHLRPTVQALADVITGFFERQKT